ncbi:hypothetical protein [Povalibacter sp.]|uniref:hypothetical protein n=1 Tax=Povalibacter sp. TaxID=1962978 RepID=UPI002F3F006B
MDFRIRLKIAAGKRLARRGGINPPPIGTWERAGWDEWHDALDWERRQREEREERESQAHITTGYFKPIRRKHAWLPGSITTSPIRQIAVAVSLCGMFYVAGRFAFRWFY